MTTSAGILTCYSCGNRTPHTELVSYTAPKLFDQFDDELLFESYRWSGLVCGTCSALSLFGGFAFTPNPLTGVSAPPAERLYPIGPHLTPPPHSVSPSDPIPASVVSAYEASWPLRYLNPGAFANQIRRCLEFVCRDQEAQGNSLAAQLKDLVAEGILPADLARVADLLREVGNIASHADAKAIDLWDAELVDELFKTMIRYIYVAPAQVRRMRERLSV
jgi:hypothetical protein